MDGDFIAAVVGAVTVCAMPFLSYGVAGWWRHAKRLEPQAILAERFANGKIDEQEYSRKLTLLTYGPAIPSYPSLLHERSLSDASD